jgi:hypothetical protein
VLKQPFLHEREFGDDSFNAFLANPIFRFSLGQGDLISPIDFSHYPFIAAARRCPSTIIAQDRSIHPLWYRNQGITHHIKAVALGLTDAQRSAIYAINSDAPVVAITGAPGTGKTALPAVAASLRPYTPRPQSPARLIPSPPPKPIDTKSTAAPASSTLVTSRADTRRSPEPEPDTESDDDYDDDDDDTRSGPTRTVLVITKTVPAAEALGDAFSRSDIFSPFLNWCLLISRNTYGQQKEKYDPAKFPQRHLWVPGLKKLTAKKIHKAYKKRMSSSAM